ncbi:MAG: double-strand break repair protein AddB [Alphaproteobacteria bacterium]|nr:double-strand break repair protein AddB [Alphaproteobacteria bacterium]
MTGVYAVPLGAGFADALARGVTAECGDDPLALGEVTILLPNRRAVRAAADAFLRRRDGRPMLLPVLRPVGDVDEADPDLLAGDGTGFAEEAELPPAIGEPRRLALLARMILKLPDAPASCDQAFALAGELARLLDQAHTERCDFARLATLAPAQFALHWQKTLDFLAIVTAHWPKVLEEEGVIDPARRRDLLLARLTARWRDHPPAGRVLIAGSTGSVKATAELMAVVAGLPRGAVILPGFDRAAIAADGDAIRDDPAHPQHAIALLLRKLAVAPADVTDWPAGVAAPRPARAALLSTAMRPAESTDAWRDLPPASGAALKGVWRVDCPGPREEAAAIALMLREVLECPGRTAALVTPDRALARRVAIELKRWGVAIDDSAGIDLLATPPGVFLRLVAAMMDAEAAPVPLLACFKHPLAQGGRSREEFRGLTRRLEIKALRGPRPAPGFAGILGTLRDLGDDALVNWVGDLDRAARPFAALLAGQADLAELIRAHWNFAEALATGPDGVGALRLGDASEALARALDEALLAVADFPAIDGRAYKLAFARLLAGRAVRPQRGQHPRLAIWGPLEARLQQADRIVLGGLNEGTWPADPADDPWMSRPMRQEFGLPALERRIGLAAHDFAEGFLAPEVILTRATRVEGTPTVASRWLLRLETVLRAGDKARDLPAGHWLDWQQALDWPARVRPVTRPAPCPPVAARPRRLSATRIETWMRDPYAIYARYILDLRRLDDLDADPGAADRGQIIHAALEAFLRRCPGPLPEDALEQLVAIGRAVFKPMAELRPGIMAFWWPRFLRAAAWFIERERERRPFLAESFAERGGRLAIDAPAGPFVLTATADRVDRLKTGGIAIIDYKTGQPPAPKHVELGFAPQLPLEAAIAAAGGFAGIPAGPIAALEVWRLTGGIEPGQVRPIAGDPAVLAAQALAGLGRLVARYDDPATPYESIPRAAFAPRYSDYAHLARVQEWSVSEDDA